MYIFKLSSFRQKALHF